MDMWTDSKWCPFMAVTAHWIQSITIDTPAGTEIKLILRSDLIGFLRVPGTHDGAHLAHAFLHIVDHIDIASKVCD